ncbi:competence protein ComG [Bacillus sp. FJAT-42376]|uniref:ComZ family protein n=1 Tax=Bacillus sp. FJAT-42376 TaxID=2014076 RepID=UPI000F4F62CD|nr:ComZ family protein [Bacillus sp. FJAT-42376]AZB42350.1 competence protein ComG [Bacillus sp. FJAT-42376]
MEQHEKQMEFMQIAMKYFPEAKEQLDALGLELSIEHIQPLLGLFNKVMAEAYELGRQDAAK